MILLNYSNWIQDLAPKLLIFSSVLRKILLRQTLPVRNLLRHRYIKNSKKINLNEPIIHTLKLATMSLSNNKPQSILQLPNTMPRCACHDEHTNSAVITALQLQPQWAFSPHLLLLTDGLRVRS